jgi:hypothetical protein
LNSRIEGQEMQSIVEQRGAVRFPEFTGERVYMREFTQCNGLPDDLSRWQSTIDQMLDGITTNGPIYLMIDQKEVKAGTFHRRPGVHIDGYWIPAKSAHGSPVPHHSNPPPEPRRGHITRLDGQHGHNTHLHKVERAQEALILASSVAACKAWEGEWFGEIGEGGDCSHIDLSSLTEISLKSHMTYAGNVAMLHASMPIPFDCQRTLVRLNVPGWSPV